MTTTSPTHRTSVRARVLAVAAGLALVATACGDDPSGGASVSGPAPESADAAISGCFDDPGLSSITTSDADVAGTRLTLATHDSFVLSEGTLAAFTAETGIEVEQVALGDAGQLVSQAVLTVENPTADVLFGIDNAFLCRGLEARIFTPYRSPALDAVDDALELDPHHRVTPISYGDVCVNYWTDALPTDPPATLDDLTDPAYADLFVTQNPETSSPGFAFLLATIAAFGDAWEEYWQALVDNGVSVTAGWNDAYYGEFIAGGGDRPIVTSYASSPPAEFLFAEPPVDAPPTGVLLDSCFRQIEFAGVLAGTDHPEAAAMLIDFMLGTTYQEDVPLNMFVYPANSDAVLPDAFVEFGPLADDALVLDPATIEANRDAWTARWDEIVIG